MVHLCSEVLCGSRQASWQPAPPSKRTKGTKEEGQEGSGKRPRAWEGVPEVTEKMRVFHPVLRDRRDTERQATGVRGSFPSTPKDRKRGLEGSGRQPGATRRVPDRNEKMFILDACFSGHSGRLGEALSLTPGAKSKTEHSLRCLTKLSLSVF